MNHQADDVVPLTEFVLESESNFAIAHAIYWGYENVRAELIAGFFQRLEADLRGTHPDWLYKCNAFLDDKYGKFEMWKPKWGPWYRVILERQSYLNRIVYGIWRDGDKMGAVPTDPTLFDLVSKTLSVRKPRAHFEAEMILTSPASDWLSPEVLWRMHTDAKFLQEIAATLRELIVLTEARVDWLVKNFK